MIYRVAIGLFFVLYACECFGWVSLSAGINGILALVGGIALLAGK